MERIKRFKKYIESISGTFDVMPFGPGMPRQKLQNTMTSADTDVIFDEGTNKFYTLDEYYDLHNKYIEQGGKPLSGGLNKENLKIILNNIK
jgi:hypothetical protein